MDTTANKSYEDVFGHADCVIDSPFDKLIVIDFKSGKGVSVPADDPQLKLYAAMAAGELIETYEKIVTIVVQPRDINGDVVKVAEHDPSELKQWVEDTVLPAIDDARSDNPTFKASEEGCRWCGYRGKCREQSETALQVIQNDYEGCIDYEHFKVPDPKTLTNEELAFICPKTRFIESWVKDVLAEATDRLVKGECIPGFKAVRRITRRKWNNDLDIDHILRKELKLRKMDVYYERMHTPTHVLDMVKDKESVVARINELIVKPEGEPTIASINDKREAYAKNDPAIDYAGAMGEEYETN